MKEVVIYTKDFCLWCTTAKAFFNKNRILFKEKNIKNKEYKKELLEKTRKAYVPLIDINGEIISGYDREKLSKVFRIEKENKK